jgi:hypothetical protein
MPCPPLKLLSIAALLLSPWPVLPATAAPSFVTGPYQDVSQGATAGDPRLPQPPGLSEASRGGVLTWAFATGVCGEERWGAFDGAVFAATNVAAHVRAAQRYIVSTGGEAGVFTCDSEQALARFVRRYDSPFLVGVDFDIEGRQTPEQIGALVRAAAAVQRLRPRLRFSFTLATHASSDGSRRSLNGTGEQVMAALAATGFESAIINLMVMDFGAADARWCVVQGTGDRAHCDMGLSALQAARHVHERYGWPYARIALTPMLGENDVAGNVFTLDDAHTLRRGAIELGLAGVHWWSLGRDRPCESASPRVSSACHGLPGLPEGAFARVLGGAPP